LEEFLWFTESSPGGRESDVHIRSLIEEYKTLGRRSEKTGQRLGVKSSKKLSSVRIDREANPENVSHRSTIKDVNRTDWTPSESSRTSTEMKQPGSRTSSNRSQSNRTVTLSNERTTVRASGDVYDHPNYSVLSNLHPPHSSGTRTAVNNDIRSKNVSSGSGSLVFGKNRDYSLHSKSLPRAYANDRINFQTFPGESDTYVSDYSQPFKADGIHENSRSQKERLLKESTRFVTTKHSSVSPLKNDVVYATSHWVNRDGVRHVAIVDGDNIRASARQEVVQKTSRVNDRVVEHQSDSSDVEDIYRGYLSSEEEDIEPRTYITKIDIKQNAMQKEEVDENSLDMELNNKRSSKNTTG